MGSIMETHLEYVEELKARGEIVLQPKVGKPMCSIDGYIKTQIPHKDAGSIFKDKNGKYGLFGDMGALHVTGIDWCDLGLCDSRCWYEWMSPESYQDEISDKYSQPSVQYALNVKAAEIWDAERINNVFIEEAAKAIQAVIHLRRGKCGIKNLFGKMADLQIMLDQMKVVFGQYEFDKVLAGKYAVLDLKLHNIEHVFGSAGSIVMVCPECGHEHMRDAYRVLDMEHKEYCVWCGDVELKPVINEEVIE